MILVGGTFAISEEVSATLAQDYDVSRVAGQNEWDTAVFVAQEIVAAVGTLPVLYTSEDVLRGEVSFFLEEEAVDHVVLLGGADGFGTTETGFARIAPCHDPA